jgi:hypothetical protein
MDRGMWATWYDLDEEDRGPFRDWLHQEYLPKLEQSGKYEWVANYMKVDAPTEVPTSGGKPHVGYTNDPMPQASENVILIAASSPHLFFKPQTLDGDQAELDPKGMLKLRKDVRHAVMLEEERVVGQAKEAATYPAYPGPAIQFGTFRMRDHNNDFEAVRWYSQSRLPLMGRSPECIRARKMMVVGGWAKHGIIYEFSSLSARTELWERVHKERLAGNELVGWRIGPRTLHTPGSPLIGMRTYPPLNGS